MYRADLFRPPAGLRTAEYSDSVTNVTDLGGGQGEGGSKHQGCRHDAAMVGHNGECEHVSLSRCIREELKAIQVIATDLVINWEGCEAKYQLAV